MWDVFAVSTYATVSLLFWYVGLVPDMATLRDRAEHPWVKAFYGMLSLGWRGSALHWRRYMALYFILAGVSTPLVLSVHSVISFDFSVGIVPGWHSTIFPPYFVAGAVFAGFAMTIILAVPLRRIFGLEDLITMRHMENMGKVMLATGLIVFYGYLMEVFFGWYSGDKYENWMTFSNRMFGPYWWSYWALIFCNGLTPQILWWKKCRQSIPCLFIVSLIVSVGMWLERFVIIVTSLSQEFMPGMWAIYYPTWVDFTILLGTLGFFTLLFTLFVRFLPAISMAEMRELVHHQEHHAHASAHH
jgi:Ni/Fe-hydrogenase subunit HybB-like protein